MNVAAPLPPVKSKQPGVSNSLLYSGSRFVGHQKSKGNQYDVEVILQYVNIEECYLCGYLKIKGLTEEYPTLTTFFDGEIISEKHPFLTRKWEADEDVDRKHWVSNNFAIDWWTMTSFFACFAEQVSLVLSVCKELQLGQLWLREFAKLRLRVHAMERTFFSPWSHYPRYSWSILCWILLHLFPKVHCFHRRLLFPPKFWMVRKWEKQGLDKQVLVMIIIIKVIMTSFLYLQVPKSKSNPCTRALATNLRVSINEEELSLFVKNAFFYLKRMRFCNSNSMWSEISARCHEDWT